MTQSTSPRPPLGWPLLPQPDVAGCLSFPSLDESVRQAIQVILQTQPGEQLMRPGFGAGLSGFVHESNTLTTRRQIRDAVNNALGRWEDRILLDRVDVAEMPDNPTHIRVVIGYRLKRTGGFQQLGLTVEVGG
ncbi:MAG: GPW/gp25 family protein [Nitrospira sp.]|nr:GPW/gp25 family protein [Nitrospira sp.]